MVTEIEETEIVEIVTEGKEIEEIETIVETEEIVTEMIEEIATEVIEEETEAIVEETTEEEALGVEAEVVASKKVKEIGVVQGISRKFQ